MVLVCNCSRFFFKPSWSIPFLCDDVQAAKQVKSGKAILVDVRDPISFEKEHAEVSVGGEDPATCFIYFQVLHPSLADV